MLECNKLFVEGTKRMQSVGIQNLKSAWKSDETKKATFCQGAEVSFEDCSECFVYKWRSPIFAVEDLKCDTIVNLEFYDRYPKPAETYFLHFGTSKYEKWQAVLTLLTHAVFESNGTITKKEFAHCVYDVVSN